MSNHLSLRRAVWLVLAGLTVSAGASCPGFTRPVAQPLPRILPVAATREQIIEAVNQNSARVQTYHSTSASIGADGIPTLRASIGVDRPRRFRLRAETPFTGPELDLGSNDQAFWFWVRRNQPPALFWCRHEDFPHSSARQFLPIEPAWLVEALGITQFDPQDEHLGPYPSGPGRVEIRSVRRTATGTVHKVTVVDDARGVVVQQNLFDAQGKVLAVAIATDHRTDAAQRVTLPHHVEVQLPAMQMNLRIDIRDIEINTLGPQQAQLWEQPNYPGWENIDLGDPNVALPEQAVRNYRAPATRPAQTATTPPARAAAPRPGPLRRLFQR